MAKKIISYLLMLAMLFSVLLISSCRTDSNNEESEKTILLTPKEKFLEISKNASSYFKDLPNAFGFDTNMAPVTDGKMEAKSFGIKLNEVTAKGESVITEPISISGETYSDIKNNITRTLGKLQLGGETVRFEYLLSASAAYFNLDKVTERMLKMPIEENGQSAGLNADVKVNEYIDYFMDNLSDDLFTAQSGKVTVDGAEIADAETITLKATVKQFNEAFIKVLEKAKTDSQVVELLKTLNISSINIDSFNEEIDNAIASLKEDINAAKEGDDITFTIITEKGVLRSLELTEIEDGKKHIGSLTTTGKDGTYSIKGSVKQDDITILDLSYQQKPNDKGSADGELTMSIDSTKVADEKSDTSEESDSNQLFDLNKLDISIKFNGQKTDNKVTIDTKIELSTVQSGLKVTIPVNATIKYEKVSDSENNLSINVNTELLGSKIDFTINSGRSLIQNTAAKLPVDDEVDVVGESFDTNEIMTKLMSEYPGIAEFFSKVLGLGPGYGDIAETGKYIYMQNEELAAYLYDNGYGWICPMLYNVEYANGKYTAQLYDGTKLSGKYVQNGNGLVIDDVGGYTYVKEDGLITISNDEIGSFVVFIDEKTCQLQTAMQYKIENGKIKIQLYTGGYMEFTYVENGSKVVINGVDFGVMDLSEDPEETT
jgi:hypothetical protein